jgi:hypothetical protein
VAQLRVIQVPPGVSTAAQKDLLHGGAVTSLVTAKGRALHEYIEPSGSTGTMKIILHGTREIKIYDVINPWGIQTEILLITWIFKWIVYISCIFYTFDALVNNEFKSAVGKSEKLLNAITRARFGSS